MYALILGSDSNQ